MIHVIFLDQVTCFQVVILGRVQYNPKQEIARVVFSNDESISNLSSHDVLGQAMVVSRIFSWRRSCASRTSSLTKIGAITSEKFFMLCFQMTREFQIYLHVMINGSVQDIFFLDEITCFQDVIHDHDQCNHKQDIARVVFSNVVLGQDLDQGESRDPRFSLSFETSIQMFPMEKQ